MPLILLLGPAAFAAGALLALVAPELIRGRSERWRQGLAVVGAVGGVAATGAATGLSQWDAVLRAGLAAAVVLLGARARPKPVLATALLLVPAAITDPFALAFAASSVGVAASTALTVRRQAPFLTSLAALLAGQAALRLDVGLFHGAASLAAALALAPLVVSGYRNLRSAHRRRVRRAVVVAAAASFVILGLTAAGVLLARRPLEDGIDGSRAGLQASREARTQEASRRFSAAASAFADARDGLEAAWVTPGRLLPVVGQNLRLLVAASRSGSELAVTAAESAGVAEAESVRVENGRLDLARVRSLQAPLETSAAAVDRALAELEAAESPWIVGPLDTRFDRQHADLLQADAETETALLAVRVLPGLLGGDGPRRYFLAVQQPAELRGSGGIIGNYGELTAVDGDLEVAKFGRDGDLNAAATANNATLDGAPPEYVARYARFTPERIWQNVSMSPHFPHVADTIEVLYPQSGGQPVDGVVSVTPRALAALLRITGPIDVPPWPEAITADNAEQILHTEQYIQLEGQGRVGFLGDVAEAVTRSLTTGSLPPPPELARLLSPVVRSGDLLLHSDDEQEQALFDRLGATGRLEAVRGRETIGLITQNAGGNKLDTYLHRSLELEEAEGVILNATITLRNESPTSGVPDVLNGSFVGDPPGTNRSYVSIHTSRTLVKASTGEAPLPMESEREAGLNVYSAYVIIPPGETRTLRLRLGPAATAARRLAVNHQPTVVPDHLTVRGRRSEQVLEQDVVVVRR